MEVEILSGSDEHLWPTSLDATYYADRDCSTDKQRIWEPECPSAGFSSLHNHLSTWWSSIGANQYSIDVQDIRFRKEIVVYASNEDGDWWAVTAHAASATLQDAMRAHHIESMAYLGEHNPVQPPFPNNLYFAASKRYELETKLPATRVACSPHGLVDFSAGKLLARFAVHPEYDRAGELPEFFQRNGELVEVERKAGGPSAATKNLQQFEEIDVWGRVWQDMSRRGLANSSSMGNDRTLGADKLFSSTRRVLVVPVPIGDGNNSSASLGLVLFHHLPDDRTGKLGTNMTVCAVDARWVHGKTVITSSDHYRFLAHEFGEGIVVNRVKVELPRVNPAIYQPLGPIATGKEYERPTKIKLSPSWYNIFSPVLSTGLGYSFYEADLVSNETSNEEARIRAQTPLESILQLDLMHGDQIRRIEIQTIINTAMVDGLSRSGLIPNRQSNRFLLPWLGDWRKPGNEPLVRAVVRRGPPKEAFSKPSMLAESPIGSSRMMMTAWYKGYVMLLDGWFDTLCVVVLLAHIAIALMHTGWVTWWRDTSGAWDSMVEMLALAITSPTPGEKVLKNTSAGVDSFRTVGAVVWVETGPVPTAVDTTEPSTEISTGAEVEAVNNNREQLRLRFQGDLPRRDVRLMPIVGEKYDRTVMEEGARLVGEEEVGSVIAPSSVMSTKPKDYPAVKSTRL
jgi:hypothetical protein